MIRQEIIRECRLFQLQLAPLHPYGSNLQKLLIAEGGFRHRRKFPYICWILHRLNLQCLFKQAGQHAPLPFRALTVAVYFADTRIAYRLWSVQMNHTCLPQRLPAQKVRIDLLAFRFADLQVNPAHLVYNIRKRIKIDCHIIRNIQPEIFIQRLYRQFRPAVGIRMVDFGIIMPRYGNIAVPRDRNQLDFACIPIQRKQYDGVRTPLIVLISGIHAIQRDIHDFLFL